MGYEKLDDHSRHRCIEEERICFLLFYLLKLFFDVLFLFGHIS